MSDAYDKKEDIENAIVALLKGEADIGGIVVNEVILGSKGYSGEFEPPLIWIMPIPSSFDDETIGTMNEGWILSYVVIGVTKDYDIEKGRAEADKLAMKASGLLVKNRPLVPDISNIIVRTGFTPADERIENKDNIHGAGVVIDVKFQNREC